MGTFVEDLDDHEGFADRRLANGGLAWGVWSRDTLDWTGYVAACGCGWRGNLDYPPTEDGEQDAVQAWRSGHAEPLLERQATRRREELGRVLEWLGDQAGRLADPATLERVSRASGRAQELVDHLGRDLERPASEREAAGEC
jgi:hypothetical protein